MNEFSKYQSLGNDFIVVQGHKLFDPLQAQALCDRHRGIGADGIVIYAEPSSSDDPIYALVQNADGSDGNFSGNGLRCLAQHLFMQREENTLSVIMAQRVMQCTRRASEIETALPQGICQEKIEIFHDSRTMIGYRVDVGNPHLIIFEHAEQAWLKQHGPFFARYGGMHANVTFATRIDTTISACTFERGVGITQACSSAAAALATLCAQLDGVAAASYQVQMAGGVVCVQVDGEMLLLRAQAHHLFDGTYEMSAIVASYKATDKD